MGDENRRKLHEIRHARREAMLARGQKPDGLDGYFEGIVEQLRPYLLTLAFSMLRNRDRAEDAVRWKAKKSGD